MLCYGVLLEPKFFLKWSKEFWVYIIIAAIMFKEHILIILGRLSHF